MSVYIKGMEMPKSCNACMFDVYGLCLINKNIEAEDELTHSCPLVHVPPHGRLIDADKADSRFTPDFTELSDFQCGWNAAMKRVCEDAQTIIPAEGGE